MHHAAIDLGGKESQLCVRGPDGIVILEKRCPTGKLRAILQSLPPSRVVLETCAESFAVAEVARSCGHEVRIVPASLVKSLGVGSRRVKTDRRDAQVLSEVSARIDLPSVHIRSQSSQELRTLLSMRDALVQARTKVVNTVRGWLRTQLINVSKGTVNSFPDRLRHTLREQLGAIPAYVERQLRVVDSLTEQIEEATADIEVAAEADPICQRLMSAPGVGPLTALAFRCTVDEIKRFSSAHHLESYLGLTPSEYSSSEHQRRGGITKAGSASMRRMLVQASWSLWRTRRNEPIAQWANTVAARRGRAIAVVALARKLAGILYALWRHNSEYKPMRAAALQLAA
jgi:transposase